MLCSREDRRPNFSWNRGNDGYGDKSMRQTIDDVDFGPDRRAHFEEVRFGSSGAMDFAAVARGWLDLCLPLFPVKTRDGYSGHVTKSAGSKKGRAPRPSLAHVRGRAAM